MPPAELGPNARPPLPPLSPFELDEIARQVDAVVARTDAGAFGVFREILTECKISTEPVAPKTPEE